MPETGRVSNTKGHINPHNRPRFESFQVSKQLRVSVGDQKVTADGFLEPMSPIKQPTLKKIEG